MKGKGGLGRGLEALIPHMAAGSEDEIVQVRLEDLKPNPYQPRREFVQSKLDELMNSIQEHGVLQPIVIRKAPNRGYEIIAGERRFRASQQLGRETIPAIVRDVTDKQAMEIALIENLQREDLNPMEVADAYSRIMLHFSLTQEELAQRVGQSRSHVANMLRLLTLPADIRADVSRGTISMGHARALLGVADPEAQKVIAKKIVDEGLSVRTVEQTVHRLSNVSRETSKPATTAKIIPPTMKAYEEEFRNRLGTSVRIQMGTKRGKIEIDYFSLDDLERILHMIHAQS